MWTRFKTIRSQEISVPMLHRTEAIDELSPTNLLLEDFLEQVTGRLLTLSFAQREEIRRELRQHLDASIAARQELGDTREAATEAALRTFGNPKVIAERFRSAYETTGKPSDVSHIPAFKEALKQFMLFMVFFLLLKKAVFSIFPYRQYHNLHDDLLFLLINSVFCLFYVLPMVLGFVVGWKRSGKPMVGVTLALALLGIATLPFSIFSFPWHDAKGDNLFLPVGLIFLLWIPLAAIPATIAGILKNSLVRGRLRFAR